MGGNNDDDSNDRKVEMRNCGVDGIQASQPSSVKRRHVPQARINYLTGLMVNGEVRMSVVLVSGAGGQ